MERYATLFKSSDVLYTPDCPVAIIVNAMVKDQNTNKVFVQLKLKNISDNIIKAVKVEIIPFSVEGKETNDRIEFQYLDLNVSYSDEFGQSQPIFLKDNTARSYKVIIKSVISSNEKWENTNNSVAEIIDYPQGIKKSIGNTDFFTKFIEYAVNEDIKDNTNTFWQKHNKDEIASQHQYLIGCKAFISGDLKNEIEAVIKKYNAVLTADRKAYDDFSAEELETLAAFEELKIRIEEEKQVYNKKKAKKNKKIIAIICAIVAFCAVFAFVFTTLIVPALQYNKAIELMNDGNYDAAIVVFTELKDYKYSENYISESKYLKAKDFMNKCNYDAAAELFVELGNYKDSTEQIEECSYQLYESAYQNAISYFNAHREDLISSEKYSTALNLFSKLNGYKDSNKYRAYLLGKRAESNSIREAYSYYLSLPTTFLDVSERLELIEQYLPYTGIYTYTKGNGASGGYKEIYISISDSNKIEIHFSGGEDYTLVKSDDSNYDYKFDNYYISKNMLYCNNSYYNTQTYFEKDTW